MPGFGTISRAETLPLRALAAVPRAITFSSSGLLLSYHAGVAKALHASKFPRFQCFTGVSGGAVAAFTHAWANGAIPFGKVVVPHLPFAVAFLAHALS